MRVLMVSSPPQDGAGVGKAIRIADNVFIGAQAGLLAGAEIGENSVVGFGAVCAGPFPPNMVIGGNPAAATHPVRRRSWVR